MTLGNLMVRSATIVHPNYNSDRYGNLMPDWGDVTETDVRVWLGRQSASEEHGTRVGAGIESWLLMAEDVTIGLATGDRVVVDAQTFEVDGPVHVAWTPRGPHHLEAVLRAVTG